MMPFDLDITQCVMSKEWFTNCGKKQKYPSTNFDIVSLFPRSL